MKGKRMHHRGNGASAAAIQYSIGACALGTVLVAWSDQGICAVLLGDAAEELCRDLQTRFPGHALKASEDGERYVLQMAAYIESPTGAFDVPLDLRGTAFQQNVWGALREIPAGATETYAGLAHRIGRPNAVRAVAQACAANPLAVIVPCHRVLRSDGGLSGYRWGVERKRWLLEREQQLIMDS
jgi:AraC family transcriptional regulator of adaptative response/methylated-DNA-[protein]-cysteine methyltransferase